MAWQCYFPVISRSLSPLSYLRFLPLQICTCVFRTCVFNPCISVREFSILTFSTLITSYLGFPCFRISSLLLTFSVLAFSVAPSVTLAYCGQTVGWIKMPRGMAVGLGPGDSVLDGDPAPPRKGAQQPSSHFAAHCSSTVSHLNTCWALVLFNMFTLNKSSAVAEMGCRLATIDMGRKEEVLCPF